MNGEAEWIRSMSGTEASTAPDVEKTGRCLCGAVQFKAHIGKPEIGTCHCVMCRRWAAGPFLGVDTSMPIEITSGEASLGVYRSSDWGERGFCRDCGASLFWRTQDGSHAVISVGALESDEGLVFKTEVFIDQKPPYYEFANDTEKMTGAELFALFTGDATND